MAASGTLCCEVWYISTNCPDDGNSKYPYQTTQCNILEDSHLHTHCLLILKSYEAWGSVVPCTYSWQIYHKLGTKIALFCDAVPYRLPDTDQHFRRVYSLDHPSSQVNTYQTTQHFIPADSHLHHCNLGHYITSVSVSLFCIVLTSNISVIYGQRLTEYWFTSKQVSEMEVCFFWHYCDLGVSYDHVDVTIHRF